MVASRWVNIAPFNRRCIEGTCCRVHDTTCLMSLISKDEIGSTLRLLLLRLYTKSLLCRIAPSVSFPYM